MSYPSLEKNKEILKKHSNGESTVITENKREVLQVNEVFSSIQCEGKSMGYPVTFVRLYGCNLKCGFGNPCGEKGCDTPYTWKKDATSESDNLPYTPEMLVDEIMQHGECAKHWVVTGGEPLMQGRRLVKAIEVYKERTGEYPYIEIETNGTILPTKDLYDLVGHFNVSVKLENSNATEATGYSPDEEEYNWNTREKRIIDRAMKFFAACPKSHFKFVIDPERKVLAEVNELVAEYNIPVDRVWVMPEGNSPEDINLNSDPIVEICKEYGYKFSTRLHILIWKFERGK